MTYLNKLTKKTLMIITDTIIITSSIFFAYTLRWGSIFYFPDANILYAFLLGPLIGIPIFYYYGFYNVVVRYMGFESLAPIVKATLLYSILWAVFVEFINIYAFPRSTGIIVFLILTFLVFLSRIVAIWFIRNTIGEIKTDFKNVAIYGAGSAGNKLLSLLTQDTQTNIRAFIDDDESLNGRKLKGIRIINFDKFKAIQENNKIDTVYIALPSISKKKVNSIIQKIVVLNVKIKILPSISELISGNFVLKDLKKVEIEDLLGRDEVEVNKDLISHNTKDKSILVTGAGGSVGSEICRQVVRLFPKKIILLEHNEFSLYKINQIILQIIREQGSRVEVIAILGSVNDKYLLKKTIKKFKIQTLYHAAAYKHVPLLEENIIAGVNNNLMGTINCANIANELNVESFIFISTDKAVNPTSLMGATKRISEAYIQSLAKNQNTKNFECIFNIVRFGNVLESSGSVIPLFKEQIKLGGPITVTSENITRYFMTIPEAAQLVIQAGALGGSGKIYVLNMGSPVKIIDLAKKMAELSGLKVVDLKTDQSQIEIKIIGLRDGEKDFEELFYGTIKDTVHPKIYEEKYEISDKLNFDEILENLENIINTNDASYLKDFIFKTVNSL